MITMHPNVSIDKICLDLKGYCYFASKWMYSTFINTVGSNKALEEPEEK